MIFYIITNYITMYFLYIENKYYFIFLFYILLYIYIFTNDNYHRSTI